MMSHRQHWKSLDGWRGIAFLAVYFFHFYPGSDKDPLSHMVQVGWLGVDLFFVLSGFLITGILFDTREQRSYFRIFYARRALRLFPVYFALVGVVIAANAWMGGHMTVWAWPFFLYGANVVWDLNKDIGVLPAIHIGHVWSLALEEQFYLFWPMVVLCAGSLRRVFWTCVAGCVFAIGLRWLAVDLALPPSVPYFELPTRLDSLLAGGALAMVMRSSRLEPLLSPFRLKVAMAVTGVALGVCLWRSAGVDMPYQPLMVRVGFAAAALFFAGLIALAMQPGSWAFRVGSVPFLRTIGRYSYGMYLFHMVPNDEMHALYVWVKHGKASSAVGHLYGVCLCGAYLGVLFLLALASYHLLELPVMRWKSHFAYSDENSVGAVRVDADTVEGVNGSPSR